MLDTLSPALDILNERVDDGGVPAWCKARGWTDFLLGLSEAELERCEAEGLSVVAPSLATLPQSLGELATRVRELSALPALESQAVSPGEAEYRSVTSRKRQQLSTLLGTLAPMAEAARRIVDVGSGSGHFARLAAQHFERDALGLERNADRVARASTRATAEARGAPHSARFAVVDACAEPLQLEPDDLAIGLHACGELGDTLVRAVAASGADLALVSCCLQKISTPRRDALSRAARGFSLRREILGLSNLTSQAVGVEASIGRTMQARQARYALRQLLRARGLDVSPGVEMRGINRRRAHSGLTDIAGRALAQRGLAPATAAEIDHHEREAERHFHAVRRLSLPRNMLARAVELSVVLDRAALLHEHGHAVRVATLFERAVTPRNVSLFASRDAGRLPPAQPARADPDPPARRSAFPTGRWWRR